MFQSFDNFKVYSLYLPRSVDLMKTLLYSLCQCSFCNQIYEVACFSFIFPDINPAHSMAPHIIPIPLDNTHWIVYAISVHERNSYDDTQPSLLFQNGTIGEVVFVRPLALLSCKKRLFFLFSRGVTYGYLVRKKSRCTHCAWGR